MRTGNAVVDRALAAHGGEALWRSRTELCTTWTFRGMMFKFRLREGRRVDELVDHRAVPSSVRLSSATLSPCPLRKPSSAKSSNRYPTSKLNATSHYSVTTPPKSDLLGTPTSITASLAPSAENRRACPGTKRALVPKHVCAKAEP